MNYKLAKQLKDAGFPHSEEWEIGEVVDEGLQCFYNDGDSIHYKPTLSELIEACGDDFFDLHKNNKFKNWEASSWTNKEKPIRETGKTPEKAVAKLWLKLNK